MPGSALYQMARVTGMNIHMHVVWDGEGVGMVRHAMHLRVPRIYVAS